MSVSTLARQLIIAYTSKMEQGYIFHYTLILTLFLSYLLSVLFRHFLILSFLAFARSLSLSPRSPCVNSYERFNKFICSQWTTATNQWLKRSQAHMFNQQNLVYSIRNECRRGKQERKPYNVQCGQHYAWTTHYYPSVTGCFHQLFLKTERGVLYVFQFCIL